MITVIYLIAGKLPQPEIHTIARSRAIFSLFGVLFAFQIVVGLLPETPTDHVYKCLPAPAGIAVTAVQPDSASLPPWAGFCLFCLYTAVVLGLADRRMHRRDA